MGIVEPYRAAREMYFHYLGSSFYMSRDGAIGEIQARFDGYQVPEEVIQQWAAELKAQQLTRLNARGNWSVLGFLEHHSYLEQALDSAKNNYHSNAEARAARAHHN